VGDDETNPLPSFVGQPIRGAFFFRNRLGFLAGDSVVLSRAGTYFNFWATSAIELLDTDPIDLSATSEEVETLDWAVPYNQNLLIWATNKQQFILTGGDVLSPANARLQPSTTFESDNSVKPVSLGNRVLFASRLGSNTLVSMYRVSDDTVTNTADGISDHIPKYIPASPRQIAASTTVRAAVVLPRDGSKEMYLFKYETDGNTEKLSQKAWQRIRFDTNDAVQLMCAHWSSRTLYLLKHVTAAADPVAGGRFVLEVIDFEEQAQDINVGFGLRLDQRAVVTPVSFDGTNTLVDVPYLCTYSDLTYLKCVSGVEPEELAPVNAVVDAANRRTRVTLPGNLMGATVWAGRKFNFRYAFTEAFLRDEQGVPVTAASVKLVRMLVRYVTTGHFRAYVKQLLRSTYTYPFSGRTIGMPGQGASELALSTGDFAIPVHTKANAVEVSIESDSWLPCKFPYAEWVGDVTMKAQR
jgi:hypothetical protein